MSEIQCRTELPGGASSVPRVVWTPPDITCEHPLQDAFFADIEHGNLGVANVEFVRGTVEQLKRIALKTLATAGGNRPLDLPEIPAPIPRAAGKIAEKLVYIICDEGDEAAVEPIEDFLYDAGFEVKIPAFDGDSAGFLAVHQQMLTICHAVLIYYGAASSQWVEMKLMDLRKAPGFGRRRPFESIGILVAPPRSRRKERFRTRAAAVMHLEEGASFDGKLLEPFLEPILPPESVD